ncbi:GNAT family N-acetyltransferase [Bacillus pseudomycoides]|uniref:GNAT family N-acetyltransferase n=1 Tax=Bacillus pseudomycoides TaxID=64104 RepID=A0AA91ZTR7_9BACI|nr:MULTISPECIES: GNAT family N-acetyltransferase [Bacillus]PEB51404.1 GNAT family N-acetyltransferase [Bacillus sp. AFS098217]PED82632.1 GNAT family N-acetyltransferase [Bacillus pseudomycoides]PEU12078.1 GNAT family N-acetyltransferase [Bacillus sp. AFS014408]PEU17738.1 GNAT family N-acetyltransferase [Bacillus sp. AFS019443]PFW60886.1 GNAT family N-acetyltransferase [Bacillus sp. AFS075034]
MSIEVKGNIVHTKRIFMRKPSIEDIDEFYEIVKNNEVGKWLAVSRGMSRKEAEQYVGQFISHWEKNGFGVWFLFNHITGEMIGHCGLRYMDGTEDVEIMYLLDPKCWGNGYATEAVHASIQYAFQDLKVKKVVARIKLVNEKSKNVLEKVGFKYIKDVDYDGRQLSYYEYTNSSQ